MAPGYDSKGTGTAPAGGTPDPSDFGPKLDQVISLLDSRLPQNDPNSKLGEIRDLLQREHEHRERRDIRPSPEQLFTEATTKITELSKYLKENVTGKFAPSAADREDIKKEVHAKLVEMTKALENVNKDKEALGRLDRFEKKQSRLTESLHKGGPDPEALALRKASSELKAVLQDIFSSNTTGLWFWKTLDDKDAPILVKVSGMKEKESWSDIIKKSLIGIGYGLAGLPPPEFDKMYLKDETYATYGQQSRMQQYVFNAQPVDYIT